MTSWGQLAMSHSGASRRADTPVTALGSSPRLNAAQQPASRARRPSQPLGPSVGVSETSNAAKDPQPLDVLELTGPPGAYQPTSGAGSQADDSGLSDASATPSRESKGGDSSEEGEPFSSVEFYHSESVESLVETEAARLHVVGSSVYEVRAVGRAATACCC
jgi:hypothetical protein